MPGCSRSGPGTSPCLPKVVEHSGSGMSRLARQLRPSGERRPTRRMAMASTTRITAVGTVGVPVTDQDRALEFYVGKLGFEKRRDLPFGPGRWIEVATADHTALQAGGIDVDPEVMRIPDAPAMFSLRDPDGNTLILVEWS